MALFNQESHAFKTNSYHLTPEGYLRPISLHESVAQELSYLLQTRKGERPLYPEVGENLSDFLFQKITPGLFQEMKKRIEKLILTQGPRDLILQDIRITQMLEAAWAYSVEIDYVTQEGGPTHTVALTLGS